MFFSNNSSPHNCKANRFTTGIITDKFHFVKGFFAFFKNLLREKQIFSKNHLTKGKKCSIIPSVPREWRNWQTRTFEGRVVLPYGFNSRLPHQQKSLFCLPTKETFLNDVCPIGQMMYPAGMMLPSAMMCPAGHEWQTSHHCGTKWRNIISEHSDETSLAAKRRHH